MGDEIEEIDEIWEVELFGQYSHWTSKQAYDNIKQMMLDNDVQKGETGVAFKTLSGAEIVVLLSSISNLNSSTKEQRVEARARSKKYKEEWEEKKENWE